MRPRPRILALAVLLGIGFAGCTTLQNLARLREVDFFLDRISGARLAGVDVERLRGGGGLSGSDVLRVAEAVRRGSVPFDFVLHVGAENPGENPVAIERVQLDWTLWLEDRETVSGVFDRALELGPGRTTDLPIDVSLDLYRFFREDASELLELAREVVDGSGEASSKLELRARPTLWTELGPLRYPGEVTIRP
jgi:hypothetical protein